jgi:hypothetical protein
LSLGATSFQLQARATDAANPCFTTGACEWLNTGINACDAAGGSADQQDYCICLAVQKGNSSQLADCLACEKTYNATIATDIQDLSTADCVAILGVATTTSTVAQSTYLIDSQCTAACNPIGSAINVCTDDACFCPTLLQYASGCSACWATVNATEATLIASVSAECVAELSSTGSATASKLTAFGGPSVVVVTVTQSQSTGIPIPVASESSTSTATATSSSSGLSSGAIAGIAVGAAVGALLLVGAGFLFYRRGKRDRVAPREEPPYPQTYAGESGYPVEPKQEGAGAPSGIRYLDPDAADEIPSGRTLNT